MKTILFFALVIIVLQACSNETAKSEQQTSETAGVELTPVSNQEIKIESISETDLPKDLVFEGNFITGSKYSDKDGEHLLIYTATGVVPSKKIVNSEDESDYKLFAYDFLLENGKYKQRWRIHDFISNCEFDLNMGFVRGALKITDVNKNGIAEVWTTYSMTCTSDVSPSDLKIIMYEGTQKCAMRGYSLVNYGGDDKMGGDYKMDEKFKTNSKEVQGFAVKLWKENCELK